VPALEIDKGRGYPDIAGTLVKAVPPKDKAAVRLQLQPIAAYDKAPVL